MNEVEQKPLYIAIVSHGYANWIDQISEETKAALSEKGVEWGIIENFRFISADEIKLPSPPMVNEISVPILPWDLPYYRDAGQLGRAVRVRERSMRKLLPKGRR